MRNFKPRYTLLNGKAHPETTPIDTVGGNVVLLRYVNAGIQYHSMGVLGAGQSVIALDGSPLNFARHYTAETIGPGQTADALVVAPGTSDAVQSLSVYDASLLLNNSNLGGAGGMYTTIDVPGNGPPASDVLGPVTSGVTVAPGNLLQASVSDADRGNSNVTAAEYFIDDVGAAGTGIAMGGSFGSPTVTAGAVLPNLDPVQQHVLYVRGYDGANWGPLSSVLLTANDRGGPTTLSPRVTPSVTNHGAGKPGVAISATADDTGSGNSNIWRAEYRIDAGAAVSMTVSPDNAAPVASIDATISRLAVNLLSEGTHVISLRSQDSDGNWGEEITVPLDIDLTGPTTSGTVVAPTPNNGTRKFNSSVAAVRVSVPTMEDPLTAAVNTTISKAEAFIDTVGTNGTGIPLIASDGLFDQVSEGGYADIPLATVKAMSNGPHTIYVHARDSAGNWGATDSAILLVDKTAPVVSGASFSPNPTAGAPVVGLSATVTDAWTAPVAAEWFIGADPGTGNGTAVTGTAVSGSGPWTLTGNLNVRGLGEGSYTLRVRVRDQAGNWSATSSVSLVVTASLYYSTLGNTSPPGVGNPADNADIYFWNGTGHIRYIQAQAAPYNLPGNANVDGFSRVDATHFYVSFSGNVNVPGVGTVADEDVVYYDSGVWSMWFDGSTHALGGTIDVGAMTVRGTTLYFSINNNATPPGVIGAGDNADVYRWNGGSTYTRIFNASGGTVGGLPSAGLPGNANVDGIVYVDDTHLYLSFTANNTTVPGLGNVQDEDVVFYNAGAWSVYFDGTAHGLGTSGNLDIDAFDLP
jgi:hypothetical protein